MSDKAKNESVVEPRHPGSEGRSVKFQKFLGPNCWREVCRSVRANPDLMALDVPENNGVVQKRLKGGRTSILYADGIQFRSGENVLLTAIVEDPPTIDFVLFSLDATTVKVQGAFGADWSGGDCTLLYHRPPEPEEFVRFSIAP